MKVKLEIHIADAIMLLRKIQQHKDYYEDTLRKKQGSADFRKRRRTELREMEKLRNDFVDAIKQAEGEGP